MSVLTEAEIFDRLKTSLRTAIDLCGRLATEPSQGPNYLAMIEELQLIEGAARQAGHWREDGRWMAFGWEMARFHQRIGDAIRHHEARSIFLHMQGMMKGALIEAEKLRTSRTGRRGAITPIARPKHRDTRPVHITRPSGLIVPSTVH